ncbi:PLP-dependent aminotransferase family protein [Streptomyces sp. NPDC086077]|uniref:aminotransferase-like domain-containing protein n=1 Tax=Streptomyces sp. NPDC086077 TaxID=3154862 RepID=UPI00341A8E20
MNTSTGRTTALLRIEELHDSLSLPTANSMNFLNEVALRFPDAISFAAGRPHEEFFDIDDVHRHLDTYRRHLSAQLDGDEVQVRRVILQYGRTKGIIHELIARHLQVDEDIVASPHDIVVTAGAQEALYLTLRALRRTDRDVLLAVEPSYVGVYGAAQLADMTVLPVADSPDGIDLDDLKAVVIRARSSGLRPRACYVIPEFSNPSGVSLTVEARKRLLRLAEQYEFLLLEDNPYGLLGVDDKPRTLKSTDDAGVVVYIGSFAKTGLPGARVGYAIAGQRVSGDAGTTESTLADQIAKIKSMVSVNTSPIAQAVIGGKLLEHDYSLRRANIRERQIYQRNLSHVLSGLTARFRTGRPHGVSWNDPAGGFFTVVTVPFTVEDSLLERSAKENGVLWTPLHHFYTDAPAGNRIRLSFSHLQPEEIDEGLDRFVQFVKDNSGS